jgi:hypothetical protein
VAQAATQRLAGIEVSADEAKAALAESKGGRRCSSSGCSSRSSSSSSCLEALQAHVLGGLDRIPSDQARARRSEAVHEERRSWSPSIAASAEGESLAAEIQARAAAETERLQQRLTAEFEQLVARRTQQAESASRRKSPGTRRRARPRADHTVATTPPPPDR